MRWDQVGGTRVGHGTVALRCLGCVPTITISISGVKDAQRSRKQSIGVEAAPGLRALRVSAGDRVLTSGRGRWRSAEAEASWSAVVPTWLLNSTRPGILYELCWYSTLACPYAHTFRFRIPHLNPRRPHLACPEAVAALHWLFLRRPQHELPGPRWRAGAAWCGRKRPHFRRAMLFGESAIADGRAAGGAAGGGVKPLF